MATVIFDSPKRLILFAGYSSSGLNVSDTDCALVEELARFGDVYCWYDNTSMPECGYNKLRESAREVTFKKHGEYDFGSWKYLYQNIGREKVGGYDELVLTNNSILLLDKLDYLFDFRSAQKANFFRLF